jgi:S-adenosylmethionine:tRNA ribosyltransferase-isomerase
MGRDRRRDPRGDLGGCCVRGPAVLDPVDDRAAALLQAFLEPRDHRLDAGDPCVDALPPGRDQIDEQCEVVDARVAIGERIRLERFHPPDHLIHQSADLREVASDRDDLLAQSFLDAIREAVRRLARRLGERFELRARAFEDSAQRLGLRPLLDALLRAIDGALVHTWQMYRGGRMRVDELEYDLPVELIAQRPESCRDQSRLLVYDRVSGEVHHRTFAELPDVIGDALVVVNDTRVVPARIPIERPRGEVLLLERIGENGLWEALARPTRRLHAGRRYGDIELLEHLGEGRWRLRLHGEPHGETPLPPYITEPLADPERYQTVYAREEGSAAAPTAGLHFTPELLARLDVERVTLHVGLDTFRPVTVDDLAEHELHGERYQVDARAWDRIQTAPRVLAVGTTTVRVLETLARGARLEGRTDLFVTPGFEFRRIDALLTNFHLPRSTLLALVMAFAGVEETRALYREAIERRYRFYSFGDAMLIL